MDFIKKHVSKNIVEADVNIVREKKKAIATISQSLSSDIIEKAVSKINFDHYKTICFERPLYCRPLRPRTPEKAPSQGNISETKMY